MARPTQDQQVEKSIVKSYEEIRAQVERDERSNLRVVEMVFATLVAQEGYTYVDAYKEAFQPGEEVLIASIQQMASRTANKPKVKAEINRIKIRIAEEEMSKEKRLGIVLDGSQMRDRIALELFAIAMSPDTPLALKIKTLMELGRLKHVDAFVGTTSVEDVSGRGKTFDISRANDAEEARSMLRDQLQKTISSAYNGATINVPNELRLESSDPVSR